MELSRFLLHMGVGIIGLFGRFYYDTYVVKEKKERIQFDT
jgi:hypothetical protein